MLRPENTAANFQGFAGNLLGLGEASLFVVIIGQVAADFDGKGVIRIRGRGLRRRFTPSWWVLWSV